MAMLRWPHERTGVPMSRLFLVLQDWLIGGFIAGAASLFAFRQAREAAGRRSDSGQSPRDLRPAPHVWRRASPRLPGRARKLIVTRI